MAGDDTASAKLVFILVLQNSKSVEAHTGRFVFTSDAVSPPWSTV